MTKVINTQRVTHSLPKSLATNREHMQNLAEMLYAMTNPRDWASNLSTNNGYKTLKYFRDFNYEKLFPYNDDFFFYKVANGWERKELFNELFGLSREQLAAELRQGGLNLVYSSATMSSNKIQLPVATYKGTNLKTEALTKTGEEWLTQFDIQEQMQYGYITYTDAGGQHKAWLVRYATGATLCKGSQEAASFDKYKRLTNCEDIFVYHRDGAMLKMSENDLKSTAPEENNTATVSTNAPKDGLGTYQIGDVVKDEWGNRWACLNGSPYSPDYTPTCTDRDAWFISVDFNDIDITGNTVAGLPKEEDLPMLTHIFSIFIDSQASANDPRIKLLKPADGFIGMELESMAYYGGIDWHKLMVCRDSVFTFQSKGGEYESTSRNTMFFLAYDDGNTDKQAVARIITDVTEAGSRRTFCVAYDESGKVIGKYQDMYSRGYKYYQTFNPSMMRSLNDAERYLGMNTWSLPWAVTTDKMYLQDIASQDMVNRYAGTDKWVTLPFSTVSIDPIRNFQRQAPRRRAETSARPSDFIGHYDLPISQQKLLYNIYHPCATESLRFSFSRLLCAMLIFF